MRRTHYKAILVGFKTYFVDFETYFVDFENYLGSVSGVPIRLHYPISRHSRLFREGVKRGRTYWGVPPNLLRRIAEPIAAHRRTY
jgi:hypothetical protein